MMIDIVCPYIVLHADDGVYMYVIEKAQKLWFCHVMLATFCSVDDDAADDDVTTTMMMLTNDLTL